MSKVAITGHTRGIGLAIAEYYNKNGYEILGFSRSNGYDISNIKNRQKIIEKSIICDIFVNNAMSFTDNSQTILLDEMIQIWAGLNKMLINISSISGNHVYRGYSHHWEYAKHKYNQDVLCNKHYGLPWVVNIKPGLVDTDLTKSVMLSKIQIDTISNVLDFIHSNRSNFRTTSISFIPSC